MDAAEVGLDASFVRRLLRPRLRPGVLRLGAIHELVNRAEAFKERWPLSGEVRARYGARAGFGEGPAIVHAVQVPASPSVETTVIRDSRVAVVEARRVEAPRDPASPRPPAVVIQGGPMSWFERYEDHQQTVLQSRQTIHQHRVSPSAPSPTVVSSNTTNTTVVLSEHHNGNNNTIERHERSDEVHHYPKIEHSPPVQTELETLIVQTFHSKTSERLRVPPLAREPEARTGVRTPLVHEAQAERATAAAGSTPRASASASTAAQPAPAPGARSQSRPSAHPLAASTVENPTVAQQRQPAAAHGEAPHRARPAAPDFDLDDLAQRVQRKLAHRAIEEKTRRGHQR